MPSTEETAENKGLVTIVVTSVMTGLGLLFVVLRLISRRINLHKFVVDDYVVILSVLINLIYVALSGVAVHYGAGRHADVLPPADVSASIYYMIVGFLFGVLSFTLPKFAVLLLLVKVLDPGVTHRRVMWVISVLYSLLVVGMIVVNFAQCQPAAKQWGAAEGTCWPRINTFAYSLALGIYSALFDFYLAIYPTVVLTRLNMGWRKKLGLSSALGFGYCAGAVTIYKCTTLTGLGEMSDFTYNFQDVVLWTNVEANCVLIGACIPTLYPLMKKIFGAAVLGSSESRSSSRQRLPTIQTIGSYGKNRRRPGHLSAIDALETRAGDNGDVEGDVADARGSGHSGETTLRGAEGDVPMAQSYNTRECTN